MEPISGLVSWMAHATTPSRSSSLHRRSHCPCFRPLALYDANSTSSGLWCISPRVALGPGVALAFLWEGRRPPALLPAPEGGSAGAWLPPLDRAVPCRGAEAWALTLGTPEGGADIEVGSAGARLPPLGEFVPRGGAGTRAPTGAQAGHCHAPTRPLWSFWQINVFFVDHAKFQKKHALFRVLSGRGVAWSDLPAP